MRPPPDRLQFVLQPPLPQVPGGRPRSVASSTVCGALARGILPRGVYSPSRDRPPGPPKSTPDLRDALPSHGGELTDDCGRSPTPGCPDRLLGRAAHLGPEPAPAPPRPLCRSRRWAVTGPETVDRLPTGLLPAGARAQPPLPSQVLIIPAGRPGTSANLVSRPATVSGRTRSLPATGRRPAREGMGRLRQTALWWTGGRSQVPGAVHPPGGDLQLPPDRYRERPSPFSLEGLHGREPAKDDGARWRRVRSSLSPARRTVRICAHPPLRIPGPSASSREAGVVSQAPECRAGF